MRLFSNEYFALYFSFQSVENKMSEEGGLGCAEAFMGPTKLLKREKKVEKKLVKVKAKIAKARAAHPKAVAPVRDQSPPRVPASLFVHATPIEHPGERLKSLFASEVRPTKTKPLPEKELTVPSYKKKGRCFTITLPIAAGFPNYSQMVGEENILWNERFLEAGDFSITTLIATREEAVDKIEKVLAVLGYQRRF